MNSTVTQHDTNWETVEQTFRQLAHGVPMHVSEEERKKRFEAIANNIEMQYGASSEYSPDAIGLSGLPGAGKSFAADILGDAFDVPVVSMGDGIRRDYRQEYGEKPGSDELADYAALMRSDDPASIPEQTAEAAKEYTDGDGPGVWAEKDPDLVIIDGVRSPTDAEVLDDAFDDFYIIDVQAPFERRLDRVQEREREGEGDFDRVDLAERDRHEQLELGRADLVEGGYVDMVLTNDASENELRRRLRKLAENNLPFEVVDYSHLFTVGDVLPDAVKEPDIGIDRPTTEPDESALMGGSLEGDTEALTDD